MKELEFLQTHVFFTTREYSVFVSKNLSAVSRKLNQMAREKEITQVTRGLWCNPHHHAYFTPTGAIPYLLGPEQGYLSFLSALHRHDVMSQIPATIQIATTGRARILKSPIGNFEFFQLSPSLMRKGVDVFDGRVTYNIASPEKALLDTFYLSSKKGKRFSKLPELDVSHLKKKNVEELLREYPVNSQKILRQRWEGLKE